MATNATGEGGGGGDKYVFQLIICLTKKILKETKQIVTLIKVYCNHSPSPNPVSSFMDNLFVFDHENDKKGGCQPLSIN